MNIFFLDECPGQAAAAHCDVHVRKMIVETAQLLSTAHHLLPTRLERESLYKPTHQNHPCGLWVRLSSGNYGWAQRLGLALCAEHTRRTGGRVHKTQALLERLVTPPDCPKWKLTPPPQAMPEDYRATSPLLGHEVSHSVGAYRRYYSQGKAVLPWFTYTNTEPPRWLKVLNPELNIDNLRRTR